MELHQAAAPTCRLKVNINCCTLCQLKVKEKLQKIEGVESVVCDSEGVVTFSGNVNPMAIVKKLEKWGKNAELLSFQKPPKQDVVQGTPMSTKKGSDDSVHGTPRSSKKGVDNSVHSESHPKVEKEACCHRSDSDSDDLDHNHDQHNDCKAYAAKSCNDPNIIWQNPDPPLTIKKQSKKSSCWKTVLALFCKKKKLNERKSGAAMLGKPSMNDGASKWQFPRMHTPEYGGSKPFQQRPFGFEPYNYPPPVMGRPSPSAPPYDPYGYMQPLPPYPPVVPRPYGFFNSRPPPKINPMIHYTSYADNYSFW